MKITAGKREEILRQRDEWNAEEQRRADRRREQGQRFHEHERRVITPVKEHIENMLSKFTALKIEVRVEREYMFDEDKYKFIRVRISCNDHNMFDNDVALSWHFEVRLNKEFEPVKETGSWSGLKAITEEQLESLSQSVEALRLINNIDWRTMLNQPSLPNYDDYYVTPEGEAPMGARPDFKSQLIEASIEECIGKDILIEGSAAESSSFRAGARVYYLVLSQTPKQYVVSEYLKSWVEDALAEGTEALEEIIAKMRSFYCYRVTKTKFHSLVKTDKDGNITTLS